MGGELPLEIGACSYAVVIIPALRCSVRRRKGAGEDKEETHEPQRSTAPEGSRSTSREVMTLWKRVKHFGTLLTTEEVFNADGTSKRVTRVRRSMNDVVREKTKR